MMNKTQVRNSLLLLLTATIWGVAFVAQSVGMDYVGPFTFNMVRSLIGGIVLIPCIFLLGRLNSPEKYMQKEKAKVGILNDRASKADERKTLLKGGICCGILFRWQRISSRSASSIRRLGEPDLSPPAIS